MNNNSEENIKVMVRIRPLSEQEIKTNSHEIISLSS